MQVHAQPLNVEAWDPTSCYMFLNNKMMLIEVSSSFLFSETKMPDHVESKRKQTEKIVELDDSEYRFALKVLEGPALTLRNFSALTTSFQLSKIGEQETLVDLKVVYETEKEEANTGDIALQPAISYIQYLEKYVLVS